MDYARLGHSGLKVSRIALGCMSFGLTAHEWRLDERSGRSMIRRALDAGVTFFDTADMYGDGESETVVGKALGELVPRDEVVIATKVYYPVRSDPNGRGLSRKALFAAIDASLRRLGTDYVDLYQVHRWDSETPIEETLEALHEIVRTGKVRYLGASSMRAWQFCTALHLASQNGWTRFVSMQPHYNLLNREEEREMLPLCLAEGVGVIPWSPLARGRLARAWAEPSSSGRVQYDQTARLLYSATKAADRRVVDVAGELADRRGLPRAQVALAWLLSRPGITAPIVGATRASHLDDAVAAIDVRLLPEEIAALEAPYLPHASSFTDERPADLDA